MTLICCCSITEATSSTTGCPPCVLVPWLNFPLGSCSNILLHQNVIALSPSCSEPALACRFCINTDPFLQEGSGRFLVHLIWQLPSIPTLPAHGGWQEKLRASSAFPAQQWGSALLSHSWVWALWGEIKRVPNPIPYAFTPCVSLEPSHLPGPCFPQIKEPLLGERPLLPVFQVSAAAD